jgi:macrolide transport system ATP-binding/permease protein
LDWDREKGFAIQRRASQTGDLQVFEGRTEVSNVLLDLRHALHAMVKRPVFTTTAVLTLALGIGATISVYALVRGLYFHAPSGVTDADRLVGISQQKGVKPISEIIRYPDYLYYRDHQTVFSGLASHFWYMLADTERSDQLYAFFVSSNYFSVLGVTPYIGRFSVPSRRTIPW